MSNDKISRGHQPMLPINKGYQPNCISISKQPPNKGTNIKTPIGVNDKVSKDRKK